MTTRRPQLIWPGRIWPWLVGLFLAGWLATAIATLPLAAVVQAVDLPEDLTLESSRGTIWDGRMTVRWQDRPPVDLRLDWNPAALLRLAAEWRVDARSAGMIAEGRLRLPVTRLPGRHIELPEATLQADMDSPWIDDLPTTLSMTGHMRLTIADWRFTPQLSGGRWTMNWSDAGLNLGNSLRLGAIEGAGRIVAGKIEGSMHSDRNNASSLPRVEFQIQENRPGNLLIEGKIEARGADLQDTLSLIGERQRNGDFKIRHEIAVPYRN